LCLLYDFIWYKIDLQTPNKKRGGHVVDAPIVSGLPFFSLFGEMGLTMVDSSDFLERYFGIVCTTWGSKMIFTHDQSSSSVIIDFDIKFKQMWHSRSTFHTDVSPT